MKRYAALLAALAIQGCSTTATKTHMQNNYLEDSFGLVVFSTVDDGTTKNTGLRVINAIGSLGGTELEGFGSITLNFYAINDLDSPHISVLGSPVFEASHPYKSKSSSLLTKWHVIKVKRGNYLLNELSIKDFDRFRVNVLDDNFRFRVTAGKAIYIGGFNLTKKSATMKTSYRMDVESFAPFISRVDCNIEEALKIISNYANYPKSIEPSTWCKS